MGKPFKIENNTALMLYDTKLNDHEIARQLEVTHAAIWHWRYRNRLSRNVNRGAQRGSTNQVFRAIANGNWSDPMKNPLYAQKNAEKKLGILSHNWKGGTSRTEYGRNMLKRKGLLVECVLCGSKQSLYVHHIDGDPKNNEVSNLAVHCSSCHAKIHGFKPAVQYRPPKNGFEFSCSNCIRMFYRNKHEFNRVKKEQPRFCSRRCWSEYRKRNHIYAYQQD